MGSCPLSLQVSQSTLRLRFLLFLLGSNRAQTFQQFFEHNIILNPTVTNLIYRNCYRKHLNHRLFKSPQIPRSKSFEYSNYLMN